LACPLLRFCGDFREPLAAAPPNADLCLHAAEGAGSIGIAYFCEVPFCKQYVRACGGSSLHTVFSTPVRQP
jgi:hypothetical protein